MAGNAIPRREGRFRGLRAFALLAMALALGSCSPGQVTVLHYAHMNAPDSIAGRQAAYFAQKVREYSRGRLTIELLPASQVGSIHDHLADLQTGALDLHHTTAAGLGAVSRDFAVLDTPYIYADVAHLMRVVAPDSPVMKKLSAELLEAKGLRLLYTFYFGTRELTCDRPVHGPRDLEGVRIRSVPFPLYGLAVEALGGTPVAIDWAQTPLALLTHAVSGQENPLDIILTSKLYETQPYLILTGHIRAADMVVMNDAAWRRLSRPERSALLLAAKDASAWATKAALESEESNLALLATRGMAVIGPGEGLDIASFEERARRLVAGYYGKEWEEYYRCIEAMR